MWSRRRLAGLGGVLLVVLGLALASQLMVVRAGPPEPRPGGPLDLPVNTDGPTTPGTTPSEGATSPGPSGSPTAPSTSPAAPTSSRPPSTPPPAPTTSRPPTTKAAPQPTRVTRVPQTRSVPSPDDDDDDDDDDDSGRGSDDDDDDSGRGGDDDDDGEDG